VHHLVVEDFAVLNEALQGLLRGNALGVGHGVILVCGRGWG
jgi:hypothetical protein